MLIKFNFSGLKLVETDEDKARHLRDSPTIPIVVPIPIRPLLAAKLARAALDAVSVVCQILIESLKICSQVDNYNIYL